MIQTPLNTWLVLSCVGIWCPSLSLRELFTVDVIASFHYRGSSTHGPLPTGTSSGMRTCSSRACPPRRIPLQGLVVDGAVVAHGDRPRHTSTTTSATTSTTKSGTTSSTSTTSTTTSTTSSASAATPTATPNAAYWSMTLGPLEHHPRAVGGSRRCQEPWGGPEAYRYEF